MDHATKSPHDSLEHPLRFQLVNELHARPSPRVTAPSTVVYLAFKEPRDAAGRDRSADTRHLLALAERHGAPLPDNSAGHYAAQMGRHELRWESHTEFITYAAFAPGLPDRAFDPALADIFPTIWQHAAPGRRVVAVLMHVEPMPDDEREVAARLNQWFATDALAAARVLDGGAVVATDFRVDPSGFMRMAVFLDPAAPPERAGRLVQRLLELETYRAMAMLGLSRARALTDLLNGLDAQLLSLVQGMADDTRAAEEDLHALLALSARLETAATEHSFRFGATRAYTAIVQDRLASLREARFSGRQTLGEFMRRRFYPAIRTSESAERRLSAMGERAARAGELLRTRVDVARSAQNQDVLKRMDERADLQLRLQHTVEGLSVVAISYYAVGLIGYAIYPLAHRLEVDKAVLLALLTPLVVVAVWFGMRRIRASLHRADHS